MCAVEHSLPPAQELDPCRLQKPWLSATSAAPAPAASGHARIAVVANAAIVSFIGRMSFPLLRSFDRRQCEPGQFGWLLPELHCVLFTPNFGG